jgi:hypothetical protein
MLSNLNTNSLSNHDDGEELKLELMKQNLRIHQKLGLEHDNLPVKSRQRGRRNVFFPPPDR